MIVDSHVHIGGPPSEAEPEMFSKLMKKHNIDKAIVFRYFYDKPTLMGNRYISGVVADFPEFFVGFAWINPNEKSAVKELRVAVNELQLNGLKLHLEMHPVPLSLLREIFREAQNLCIPLIIHLGDDFKSIDTLCKEFNVDVIIAHLGTGVYRLDIERLKKAILLAKHDNIFLETSGNTYPFIDYAVRQLSASKIIFGSDFPHEHPLVSARIVELLELPSKEKELILNQNIRKILAKKRC
ncbi:MAG: amidohydrolase family protein [Candidatus Bathyarchaeota archaeon]